jgi:hypothetical protein
MGWRKGGGWRRAPQGLGTRETAHVNTKERKNKLVKSFAKHQTPPPPSPQPSDPKRYMLWIAVTDVGRGPKGRGRGRGCSGSDHEHRRHLLPHHKPPTTATCPRRDHRPPITARQKPRALVTGECINEIYVGMDVGDANGGEACRRASPPRSVRQGFLATHHFSVVPSCLGPFWHFFPFPAKNTKPHKWHRWPAASAECPTSTTVRAVAPIERCIMKCPHHVVVGVGWRRAFVWRPAPVRWRSHFFSPCSCALSLPRCCCWCLLPGPCGLRGQARWATTTMVQGTP